MSSYVPTDWVDGTTPLDEAHFDKIEQAIRKRQATEGASLTAAATITVTDAVHPVSSGATISTINGGVAGQLLLLYAVSGQTFTLDSAGNIWATPAGGTIVVGANQAVLLYFTGTQWRPVGSPWTAGGGGSGGGLDWEGAWAGATPYVKGDVVTYQGVVYGAVNDSTGQTPPAASQFPVTNVPVALVTSLPTSPFDGQEVIFVDVIGAATYQWHLRYVAARGTNKWIFIGGVPIYNEVATAELNAAGVGTYVALPTVGPSITVPVAGDYSITLGAGLKTGGSGGTQMRMSYDIGATAAVDADALYAAQPSGITPQPDSQRTRRKTFAAGAVLVAKYKSSMTDIQAQNRMMELLPIAVGG